MKKKIIALLLATVIVVGAALGGTLAYLTDGQGSVNVATVGNVKIEQFEVDRNGNEFKQGQPLYPAYYQGEAPVVENGYWTGIEGAIDKLVYVVNEGRSDAYIRTWIALECPEGMELYKDILVNKNTTGIEWTKDDAVIYTTIDGQRYAIICATYTEALVPGAKSVESLLQVAMAKHVNDEAYGGENNKTYEILAFTQAVQTKNMPEPTAEEIAAGIETKAEKALCVAFNGQPSVNNIPWDAKYFENPENDISDIVDEYNFVTNEKEFMEAIAKGESVTLTKDITFDELYRTSSGGNWYEGLYYVGDESFTIDLNGNTITNDSAVNDYLMLFKNNGEKESVITIKNGTLEASSSAYCAICTSTTSTQKITINLENVNVIGNNSNGAVIKIRGGSELNVKKGTVIEGKDSYVGIECAGATVNIYDGVEIYQKGTSSYVGSLVGVSGNGTVNVYGGSGESEKGGFIAMTSGGTINIYGGEWKANKDGTVAGDNKAVLIAQSENGADSIINVTGGKFFGGYNCYGAAVGDAQINIFAGEFNADPSAYFDTENAYKVENADGTFTVKVRFTEETIGGATYLVDGANNNSMSLYLVPADYANEIFAVADGTVSIGNYAFAYNTNVKTVALPSSVTDLGRGFDSSTVEKVILNEGLTTISSRAFRSTTALKEVVISSTVETIADNAFQKSGIKTVTIPANVETIGETAFGSSLVETVIIEGNTSIQGYAFRGCPNLRTVYLYGDDVTFIPSTLNGRNSTWFCNGESNNPNTSNITFYVQNETVAARVKAAMGAEAGNTKIYIMANGNADLDETIASGAKNIYVNEGRYTLPSSSLTADTTLICADGVVFNGTSSLDINGATIIGATFKNDSGSAVKGTINGTFKDCTFESGEALRWCYTDEGETVVFENCVIKTNFRGFHFDGMDGNVIFRNCAINGFNAYGGKGTITFEKCTFGNDASSYNGLNIYSNTVLKDCTFNYTSGKTNFIDMEGEGKTLTITNCTATLDGKATEVVNFVGGSKLAQNTVKLDGNVVVSASTQEELSAALNTGDVKVQLPAGEYTMPSSGTNGEVIISGTKDTVIDVTNGAYLDSADGVTIEGVTIKTGTGKVNGNGSDYAALYAKDVTYINCTFVGPMRVGRDGAKFINCTFTDLGNDYVWTYGNDVTFEGCTFKTAGKAILIYSDGGNEVSKVTVKNCTFEATAGAKAGAISNQNCAAIEIHNYGNGVDLVTAGNTYDSNFSGEWRIKTYENGKPAIFVNGTEYNTIAIDGKTMTIDANKNVTVNN